MKSSSDQRAAAERLLTELAGRGIKVERRARDQVRLVGNRAAFPDEILARAKSLKEPLLYLLSVDRTSPCRTCHQFAFPEPERQCFWCRRYGWPRA